MANSNQWTEFWKQGFPTSFSQELPDSYTGAIGNYWRGAAAKLNKEDRVLDVACGNGAVAILIAKEGKKLKKHLEIHSSDAANIAPLETNKNPKLIDVLKTINFHAGMPIEKIDALEKKFDLITSQFGFEYSNTETATASIYKALKKEGVFKAICHFTGSQLYKNCLEEIEAYQLATGELEITEKTRSFLETLGSITSIEALEKKLTNEDTQSKLEQLVAAIEKLIQNHPQSSITAFIRNSTEDFLANQLISSVDIKRQFLNFVSSELKLTELRSKDQINAALSEEDISNLSRNFSKLGMQIVTCEKFHDEQSCIGWLLEFRKL